MLLQGPLSQRMGPGPKYHSDYDIWAVKPHYLGTWSLRANVVLLAGFYKALQVVEHGFPAF